MTEFTQQKFESHHSQQQEQQKNKKQDRYLDVGFQEISSFAKIDAPRQIPKKSYSLAPDMATGWKPKRKNQFNFKNVFPINFSNIIIDEIIKYLIKKKSKYGITYLGPRKQNSYMLHQNKTYQNPYPVDKKVECYLPQRPGVHKSLKLVKTNLFFNSDFQSGNLDTAIQVSDCQFDLFMRVDTNTKGHTNWYYFQVKNCQWVGTVKFNICNFRRQKSLYQRGMKPYVISQKQGGKWSQKGYDISYQRKPLRYKFLYDDDQDYIQLQDCALITFYHLTTILILLMILQSLHIVFLILIQIYLIW